MVNRSPTCPKCGIGIHAGGFERAKRRMALHLRDHTDMTEAEKIEAWKKMDFGPWPGITKLGFDDSTD
jgi:hypothetical protein